VQPIKNDKVRLLNNQGGLFTVYRSGLKSGELVREHRLGSCVRNIRFSLLGLGLQKKAGLRVGVCL